MKNIRGDIVCFPSLKRERCDRSFFSGYVHLIKLLMFYIVKFLFLSSLFLSFPEFFFVLISPQVLCKFTGQIHKIQLHMSSPFVKTYVFDNTTYILYRNQASSKIHKGWSCIFLLWLVLKNHYLFRR